MQPPRWHNFGTNSRYRSRTRPSHTCQHRHDLFSKLPIYAKKQWFDQQWKTICNIFSTAPWTCWLNWESALEVPQTSLMYASVIQLSLCLIFIDSQHSSLWSISRGDCPFVALRSSDMTVGQSKAGFPVDDFCKLVRLMDTRRIKPKLTLCSRIRKLSSKNMSIFWYNPLSIKAVIPLTRAGAPLHSHWLATRRVTGRCPRCIHWKCLRFWDTLTLNSSTVTRYPWMPQTYLTDWIFMSSV